ncbi:hypothetical protein PC116_g32951, partial [Phytophthora cactorum]
APGKTVLDGMNAALAAEVNRAKPSTEVAEVNNVAVLTPQGREMNASMG